jgi:hypothetical protein
MIFLKYIALVTTYLLVIGNVYADTGLDFPGSAAVSSTMRFKFDNPHLNGLPIYGQDGKGVTYIWRVYPRRQAGYYTTFFWGNDGNFWWDSGAPNTYYGFHPYPQPVPNGTAHKWEIAGDYGGDYLGGDVVYDRWYLQAARIWADGSGKHHEFYWDLPNTDSGHRVTMVASTGFGEKNPPSPVLAFGDAPWAPGNEVHNGVLRGIQIYSGLLSVNEILEEATSPMSTAVGQADIWYLNVNPTPTDISDKSGKGHNPVWVGSERPAFFVSNESPAPTAPTVSLTASPSIIDTGANSILSWSSMNADRCAVSGAWSRSKLTSGSESVSPTSTSTYNLTCTGAGGSAEGYATIQVNLGSGTSDGCGLDMMSR